MAEGLFNQFSQQFDPLSTGLSLLATNDGRMNGGQSLATALLSGRQARLQQIQAETEKNAAERKAKTELQARQGDIYKDYALKGYTGIQFPDTTANPSANPYIPTSATYNPKLDPSTQGSADFGVNAPVFVNPKTGGYATLRQDKAGNQFLQDVTGKRITDATGFVMASQDPEAQRALAAAKAAGGVEGGAQADAANALPGAEDNSKMYKDVIRSYMNFYPVRDNATGMQIDPTSTQFNPATMTAGETNSLTSGITAGLPSIRPSGREIDTLRKQIASREFIDQLIGSKAQGATFGSLTEGEGKKIEGYRTVLADPDATPRQRASASYNLFQEIDKATARIRAKASGKKTELSPSASKYFQ
jgi:hypothetical protein